MNFQSDFHSKKKTKPKTMTMDSAFPKVLTSSRGAPYVLAVFPRE